MKAVEVRTGKPRIFQKLIRENSFGSINYIKKQPNEEKTLGSDSLCASVETQTEWSYLQDIELISNLRKHLAVAEWKALIARGTVNLWSWLICYLLIKYLRFLLFLKEKIFLKIELGIFNWKKMCLA